MRTKIGTVTSAKMQKTVAVTVHRYVMHPTYNKRYRVSKKFLADTNGQEDIGMGDEVEITECRPLSKRKTFRVTSVLRRAPRLASFKSEEIESQIKRDHRDSDYKKEKVATPDVVPVK
jgi:small subunit ribosomal protein S17